MTPDTFLTAENIVKRFGTHTALDGVSISVPRGRVFGLLGPNGAGKTTLIRIINRITVPDSGTITFDGHPFGADDVQRIGYLPEERGLYKKMKVGEQAVYLASLRGLSAREAKARLKAWFEKFGIESWWNKKLEELSKGMQQKVQFIITAVHEPDLLILDEPFSGFDPVNAELLKKEILALRDKGATIIFSTHNMASVEEVCDDIALIHKSHVVLQGQVTQIKEEHRTGCYEVVATEGRRREQRRPGPRRRRTGRTALLLRGDAVNERDIPQNRRRLTAAPSSPNTHSHEQNHAHHTPRIPHARQEEVVHSSYPPHALYLRGPHLRAAGPLAHQGRQRQDGLCR